MEYLEVKRHLRYPGQWNLDSVARAKLELYRSRARELKEFGLKGYPAEAAIHLENDVLDVQAELPNETALRSAAMAARLFYMDNEQTQFFGIANTLWKATQEDRFRDAIKEVRSEYSGFLRSTMGGEVRVGTEIMRTKGDLLDIFFNGGYFHSDPEYRKFVESSGEGLGPLFKQQFAQSIHQLQSHVVALMYLVENALGEDQLARCDTAKKVQEALQSCGYPPTAIDVHCFMDHTQVECSFYDVTLKSADQAKVLGLALEAILKDHPGYKEYLVTYRTEDGDLHSIVHKGRS